MKNQPKKIPRFLQPILWSCDVNDLNLRKHKDYIIHQTLMYGNFKQIKWLFCAYQKKQIVNAFLDQPQKVYTKPAFYFAKNFLLNLTNVEVDEGNYVMAFYGPTKPRIPKKKSKAFWKKK